MISRLMESGVDFVTTDFPFANRFTIHVLAAVAEYESRLQSERTQAAMAKLRVRITAQLIEAETGAHLWADRFDGALENVFDLQDRITDSVVGIIEPSLRKSEIERSRRKRPENLDAYDLYLRALPHVTLMTAEGAGIGARLLDDALTLDPNYAAAHAHLAWCHETLFVHAGHDEVHRTAGVRHARIAVASGTDDAAALALAAHTIAFLGRDHCAAIAAVGRALSLNASSATAHLWGAYVHAFSCNSA